MNKIDFIKCWQMIRKRTRIDKWQYDVLRRLQK